MSVIAYVLGSNCYIEGLTKINYMELATKQGLYTHTEGSFMSTMTFLMVKLQWKKLKTNCSTLMQESSISGSTIMLLKI